MQDHQPCFYKSSSFQFLAVLTEAWWFPTYLGAYRVFWAINELYLGWCGGHWEFLSIDSIVNSNLTRKTPVLFVVLVIYYPR